MISPLSVSLDSRTIALNEFSFHGLPMTIELSLCGSFMNFLQNVKVMVIR